MRTECRTIAAALAAAALAIPLLPTAAMASPVCTQLPRAVCGGRVFPEPMQSATALTYAETIAGLESLAAEFPEAVTLDTVGQSFDGAGLYVVEVTAPDGEIPREQRKVVYVSQSIHGNEPGGREGGVRFLEDLLRGVHPAAALLDRVRLVQVFLNPDGWRAGDHDAALTEDPTDIDSVAIWARGNGNGLAASDLGGVDLNRQFPWRGWIPGGREPLSEPESRALAEDVARRRAAGEDLQVSTDIHGEVTDAAAWIMLSSGQFDLQGMLTQLAHGVAVDTAVDEVLADDQLVTLSKDAGRAVDAAILTASSEFGSPGVGGSGSGFLGDWLAQPEGGDSQSISTIELFALEPSGPGLSSTTFRREIFQIYRDTVTAILGAMMQEAVVDYEVEVQLPGPVGYVVDPTVTVDPVHGEDRTPMDFFTDLAPFVAASAPLVPLAPDGIDPDALADLAAVVVTSSQLAVNEQAAAALRGFAEGGGSVVVTDAAAALLPALSDDLAAEMVVAGRDDLGQFRRQAPDHPLLAGTRENGYLLLEPATLGYAVNSSDLPVWTVDRTAFEAAGGTTVATGDGGGVLLGQLPVGSGRVVSIGVLLPQPQAHSSIRYGLNSYAPLDVGYQILLNALGATVTTTPVDAFTGDPVVSITEPPAVESGVVPPEGRVVAAGGQVASSSLPTTGGGLLAVPGLAALALGSLLRHRRHGRPDGAVA